jgi:hypothetical protein
MLQLSSAAMTTPGFSISDLARRHAQAAVDEGKAKGYPADSVARALLGVVVEIYQRERGVDDIRRELTFVAEHLGDDDEFEFMRP